MPIAADRVEAPTAIQTYLAAIFVSLELSRPIWLIPVAMRDDSRGFP